MAERKSMPQPSHEDEYPRGHEHPDPMSGSGKAMPTMEKLPGRSGGSSKGPKASPQL
jgi:hypothetical protein